MRHLHLAGIALIAVTGLAACTPPGPPTVEQKCATAVAGQTGVAVDKVAVTGTVATAIGPKIYTTANGATYTCQGDNNGNISAPQFQS